MTLAGLLVLAVTAAVDPCAEVASAPKPDPQLATEYLAVADAERKQGARDTAAAGYREALRYDPTNARARAALVELCRESKPEDDFHSAVALMESGQHREAIAAFEKLRARNPDPSVALLEGICHYELGDDRAARPLLESAVNSPEVGDSARLFLGLIAYRAGEGDRAVSLLQAASSSRDPRLETAASDLLNLARRDGKLVLSFSAHGGYDSNVDLRPDGTRTPGGGADAIGSFAGAALLRPTGHNGLFARAVGHYSDQLTLDHFDLAGASAAGGWQLERPTHRLLVEYAFEYLAMGASPYLSGHRLLGAASWQHDRFMLGASYSGRLDSLLTSTLAGYSGLTHQGELEAGWRVGRSWFSVAWELDKAVLSDEALSYVEQGPSARAHLGVSPDLRLVLTARYGARRYGAQDPQLRVVRNDGYADGAVSLEYDFLDHWTLEANVTGRKALSNSAQFAYTQVTGSLGLSWAMGVL